MNKQKENPVISNIFERKSVRNFSGQKVSKEDLDKIVRAGMAAPSARNIQPWHFIVVTEEKLINKLYDALPYVKMIKDAGSAIVVCGIPDDNSQELSDYWVQDCSAATQNILLAVEALGYGAVWTGVYPRKQRVESVKRILNIPAKMAPLNVIPVGVPAGPDQPKDKYNAGKISWELYE